MKPFHNTNKYSLLIVLAVTFTLTACHDNEDFPLKSLSNPSVKAVTASSASNRLAYRWNTIEGAREYYYTLTDKSGSIVASGLGSDTTATFTNLEPMSTYRLNVTAFSRLGNYEYRASSDTVSLISQTQPVLFSQTIDGPNVSITWKDFEDVTEVDYAIKDKDGNTIDAGTAEPNGPYEHRFTQLGTFTLILTDYVNNNNDIVTMDNVTTSFDITALKKLLWTITGKAYLQGLNQTIDATMSAYDDGTYIIKNFYGGTKDFEFSVNSNCTIQPLNADGATSTNFTYIVGRSEEDEDLYSASINKNKSFAFDSKIEKTTTLQKSHGKVTLSPELMNNAGDEMQTTGDGMYTFTW